jgi:hypothetical protein
MVMSEAFRVEWAPRLLSVLRIVEALLFLQHGLTKLFGFPGTAPANFNWFTLAPGLASLIAAQLLPLQQRRRCGGAVLLRVPLSCLGRRWGVERGREARQGVALNASAPSPRLPCLVAGSRPGRGSCSYRARFNEAARSSCSSVSKSASEIGNRSKQSGGFKMTA